MRLVFSPLAVSDFEAILEFIAADNAVAALRFVEALQSRCESLLIAPRSGRARPELAENVRSVPHGQYVVFYSLTEKEPRIERVLHGARDIPVAYGLTP